MKLIRLSLSAIVTFVLSAAAFIGLEGLDAPEIRTIAGTLAATAATLFGFVLAALAIMVSLGQSNFVSNLKVTGHYGHLTHALFASAVMFMIAMVLSIASLFLTKTPFLYCVLASTTAFIISCVTFGSAGRKFYMLVTLLD